MQSGSFYKRALDSVVSVGDALPRVMERNAGRIPVLIRRRYRARNRCYESTRPSGARRSNRPSYASADGGADGVTRVTNILRREFESTMALTGKRTSEMMDRSVLWPCASVDVHGYGDTFTGKLFILALLG